MIGQVSDHGVHSQLTKVVTQLDLANCTCIHTNTYKEVHLEDQLEFAEPVVMSSRTEQGQDIITRRTEVRYLKKKYIIQDVYQFDYSPGREASSDGIEASIQSSENKRDSDEESPRRDNQKPLNRLRKLCIFQKHIDNGKRNTKNLPKNFFKGFFAFIQALSKTQKLEDLLQVLRSLGKTAKYNNMLIQKLLSNPRISPYFRDFLKNHAEEWIGNSKITDKGVHLQAVPIYLSLFRKYHYAEGDVDSSET